MRILHEACIVERDLTSIIGRDFATGIDYISRAERRLIVKRGG